jgi:hypothetical protein
MVGGLAALDLVTFEVDLHRFQMYHPDVRSDGRSSDDSVDAGHQFVNAEWLGDIVVGSRSIPAGALEEIRRLRNQGATLRGLAVALNRATFRTRRGTPWRLESVARVVKKTIVR